MGATVLSKRGWGLGFSRQVDPCVGQAALWVPRCSAGCEGQGGREQAGGGLSGVDEQLNPESTPVCANFLNHQRQPCGSGAVLSRVGEGSIKKHGGQSRLPGSHEARERRRRANTSLFFLFCSPLPLC